MPATLEPRAATGPITLRIASGSFMKVTRVYAFDASTGRASVRIEGHGQTMIETVSLSELEALDANRRFVDVEATVRRAAGEVIAD